MSEQRRGRVAFALAAAAVVWSALSVAGAFTLPAYGDESCVGGSGLGTVCRSETSTLYQVNGRDAIELLGGVAAVTLLAALALHRRCARGTRGAKRLAWIAIAALAGLSIVGASSIGIFVFPVALLLAAAAALTPTPPAPAP